MTNIKIIELMQLYEAKLREAGYDDPQSTNTDTYALVGSHPENVKASGRHLLWMLSEARALFLQGRGPKAFRWLGFVQHAMIDLKLFTLTEIKDHAKNADEYQFPPPPGLPVVQAKLCIPFICGHCGTQILSVCRQTWVPQCGQLNAIRLPTYDPDNRLADVQDIGINIDPRVHAVQWDYTDLSLLYLMVPTVLSCHLTEESVALAVSLLKNSGWMNGDDTVKTWPERWANHYRATTKDKLKPECPCPRHPLAGVVEQLSDDDEAVLDDIEADDIEFTKKPKKKKKKKKGGKKDGEEGSPDAGGQPK